MALKDNNVYSRLNKDINLRIETHKQYIHNDDDLSTNSFHPKINLNSQIITYVENNNSIHERL